ncbi:iron-sulfur cluster-binding domain-containing protein [Chitinophaga agrisoli]|uniref:Iron-sulfur cluster-binding domain-containing protein n=1 Tax=Chitinophaga agrisoli TaxID=2607653 RepID=A0A5B2W0G8_9BACT|nr:iron-sulfur cluster-binding domain-containing protein [Chitinophaga agrisoli]KAA2244604.1 iron-sulfur cluster-binding domain-containing protein [Chitinophaga agrisoli]
MQDLYLRLRITAIIKETPDTYTYHLEQVSGEPVVYQPGQFLTFLIDLHGVTYRRSYSCSSTPGIDAHLSVTIREKQNGEISRHILGHWRTGDIVTSLLPSGRFTLDNLLPRPRHFFLMAAGSGISPIFSLLKHILYREPSARVTLIYSTPSPEQTIFFKQLQALQVQFSQQLHCVYLFSKETPEGDGHYVRRLSNMLLEPLVREQLMYDPADAQFFLCGPADYMRMILLTLTFMGFSPAQLHKENFVVNTGVKLERAGRPDDSSIKHVTLKMGDIIRQIEMPGNQDILTSALEQGITLPYSCKGGVCGSCTAKCTSGKVWMAVNEVLTDRELAQGLVLTCVGYPASDQLTIEW